MSRFGFYVHVPFCHARCGYCDFVTFTGQDSAIPAYVDGLIQEIDLLKTVYGERFRNPSTVFFGGGTPSLLNGLQIHRLLTAIETGFGSSFSEVTMEANPESITLEKALAWRDAGVNRISVGLQSFDDDLLKAMGRLHTADGFRHAYRALRDAGFSNVNVDLIYGFKDQSFASWQQTVREAVQSSPEHISMYALSIEAHTPFAATAHEVNADDQAEMYEWARRFLAQERYEQYEISNFSKPGKACEHNLIYWRQQPYLAAGVGAVGCAENKRWQVEKNFHPYFKALKENKLPWASTEVLDDGTQKFERLMLGLRLRSGFDWGEESNQVWQMERSRLQREGLLEEVQPGLWRIPDRAVALTNQILLPFL